MDENRRSDIDQLSSRSPGDDPEDPYADVDISELPEWWQRAIREFEAHDLRPYRPPRFADGTLTHRVVETLERDLGVDVSFGSRDDDYREQWEVRVDGSPVEKVARHRSPNGYTVYEIGSDRFESLVRSAVG